MGVSDYRISIFRACTAESQREGTKKNEDETLSSGARYAWNPRMGVREAMMLKRLEKLARLPRVLIASIFAPFPSTKSARNQFPTIRP